MSDERDPHRPADDPGDRPAWTWGATPPPPPSDAPTSPYGTQPYPAEPSTQPYGAQPYGRPGAPSSYGQKSTSPYGALPPGAYPMPPMATRRSVPGTVVGAAVLTFVFAGMATAYLLVLGAIGLFVAVVFGASGEIAGFESLGLAFGVAAAVALVLGLWGVAACVMAGMTIAGSAAARMSLVVSSVLTAALGGVGTVADPGGDFGLVMLGWVVVPVVVVVLLFTGGANAWFHDRGGRTAVAMTPGYDGRPHPYRPDPYAGPGGGPGPSQPPWN